MEMVARDLIPNVANYKLKVNGFHLVATLRKIEKPKFRKKNDLLLQLFNKAFEESEIKGLTDNNQINYINERMIALYKVNYSFDDLFEIEEYNGNFIDTNPIEKRLSIKCMLNLRLYRFYSIVPTILFISPSESTMMVLVLLGATYPKPSM